MRSETSDELKRVVGAYYILHNLTYSNWNVLYSNDITYHTGIFNLCLRLSNGSLYFLIPGLSPGSLSRSPNCIYRLWPPICLYLPWHPICIYQPWPSICFYPLWPKFVFTSPGSQLLFTDPGRNFAFTGPGPYIVFTNPGPVYDPHFLFISPGQDFITTTTATSTITTTTATTTSSSKTTNIATTTATANNYNNNKRHLRGSKLRIKWPLKGIWLKNQVLSQ